MLCYAQFDKKFEIHTNVSDFAISGIFMQKKRSVLFESKKLSKSQLRWPMHEKRLFAMVHCLKTWRHYLGGRKTKVYIDNISLKYFTSKA